VHFHGLLFFVHLVELQIIELHAHSLSVSAAAPRQLMSCSCTTFLQRAISLMTLIECFRQAGSQVTPP